MQQGRGRVYGKEDTTSQSAVRWVWKEGEREINREKEGERDRKREKEKKREKEGKRGGEREKDNLRLSQRTFFAGTFSRMPSAPWVVTRQMYSISRCSDQPHTTMPLI